MKASAAKKKEAYVAGKIHGVSLFGVEWIVPLNCLCVGLCLNYFWNSKPQCSGKIKRGPAVGIVLSRHWHKRSALRQCDFRKH